MWWWIKIIKYTHQKGSVKWRIWGAETLKPIAIKFACRVQSMTLSRLSEDRLRGFGAARGRILAFSIDWLRRLLALPPLQHSRPTCACVIQDNCSVCARYVESDAEPMSIHVYTRQQRIFPILWAYRQSAISSTSCFENRTCLSYCQSVRDNYNLKSRKYVCITTYQTLNLILTLIITLSLLLNSTQ